LIAISVIGHVDSGKSTLTGQMATRFGQLDSRALSKLEKDAMENNKSSFALAYFTDKTEQERKRGVTIQTTLVKMETKKFAINFLDCPGHADYIKNATNGCKQSDLSIVVVPARFEASCSAEGTLKTHLTLAGILGSKNFIVCINKLDEVEIKNENSLETAFEAACEAVYKFLKRLGVKREAVIFLPISALKGIGVFTDSEKKNYYSFFKGYKVPKVKIEGQTHLFTLEDAIDYQDAPPRALDKPLRMPISSIAHVPGHGAVLCGRVDYGIIKKGDMVKILPVGITSDVKSIEAHKQSIPEAPAGANIGFVLNLKGDKTVMDKIKTGSLVGPSNDTNFNLQPFYIASCMSLKKSKGSDDSNGIKAGYTPVISCGTSNVACKFAKLLSCTTGSSGTIENPNSIPANSKFSAIIYPTKPSLFEKFTEFPGLGKFVCRDSGILVVCGNITDKITDRLPASSIHKLHRCLEKKEQKKNKEQ